MAQVVSPYEAQQTQAATHTQPRPQLIVDPQRLPPARGLVPLHNRRGKPFPLTDLHRIIRLNRLVYKIAKAELANAAPPVHLDELIAYASDPQLALDVRLSLRTDCSYAPPDLAALPSPGLFDLFLTPLSLDDKLRLWFAAGRNAGLPIRLQIDVLQASVAADSVDELSSAGVRVVNIVLDDPFMGHAFNNQQRSLWSWHGLLARAAPAGGRFSRQAHGLEARATIDDARELATALEASGIEANLIGLPYCVVPENERHRVLDSAQFFLDHQQIQPPLLRTRRNALPPQPALRRQDRRA